MAGKREQQMKEITERLEQGVKELFTSEMYTEYLKTMSQFHNYSFNNTLLIAMQKPDATLVAGYQAWQKKFKRQVKKGEKGIQIIAPAPIREKEEIEKFDPETNEPILRPDGQPETEEVVHTIPRFRVATVFDVSQTYGEPLPELETPELMGNVENYEFFMQALREISPVPMRFDEIESGAKGYYSNTNKEIVIQSGMSESQTMKTGIHETTHAKLHDREIMEAMGEKKNQMTREVEAESVAYTVCQYFGLDTSDYSFPYIAGWSSSVDMKELRASMDTIRKTAGEMIDGMSEVMQRLMREQPEKDELEEAAGLVGELQTIREYQQAMSGRNPAVETEKQENAIGRANEQIYLSGNEDRYAIYQIAGATKGRDYRFMGMDFVTSHDMKVDAADYAYVYGGRLSGEETLDSLYEKFNINHPAGYEGHSLSVSDVVVLQKEGMAKAYYVDSFGFTELPDFVRQRLHEAEMNRKREDSLVTLDTSGIEVEQHEGLWHTVDKREIGDEIFYLMKHNEFGDSVAAVIVNADGELVAQELENGFDRGAMEAVREYLSQKGIAWEPEEPELKEWGIEPEPDMQEKEAQQPEEQTVTADAEPTQKQYPPVYQHTADYAAEHAAADEYLDSRKLNIDCKRAVEEAIRTHFDGLHLEAGAVEPVLEEYGQERLAFVLACTVQNKAEDGRFSRETKAWAEGISVPENISRGRNLNLDYVVDSHPAVLDGFIGLARDKFAELEKGQEQEKAGPFIARYYVVNDAYGVKAEREYQYFDDIVDALSAYSELPNHMDKQIGMESTEMPPSRMALIHCKNGIEDMEDIAFDSLSGKWANDEVTNAYNRAQFYLDNHDTDIVYELPADKGYFYIQTTAEGWYDYTFYDSEYREMDGGSYENPDVSIREAVEELLAEEQISLENCHVTSWEEFMDKAAEAGKLELEERAGTFTEKPFMLTGEQADVLDKIARASGMDCWFSIGDDNTYIYDFENNDRLSLKEGIQTLYEGMTSYQDYEMTAADISVFEGLLNKIQIEVIKEELPLTSGITEPEKALGGMSRAEIEETVLCYAQAQLEDMGLADEVKLNAARVYGSRTREGLYNDGSDVDVVLSYTGNIREDDFFSALHEEGMEMAGLPLDINPISTEKTGTLQEYLEQAEKYLDNKWVRDITSAIVTFKMEHEIDRDMLEFWDGEAEIETEPIYKVFETIGNAVERKDTGKFQTHLEQVIREHRADEPITEAAADLLGKLTGKVAVIQKEPKISFYVAECMEFPILGEYHDNLTLEEAVQKYEEIPPDRINGVKGIGFRLEDGSMYDGDYELMSAGAILKDSIDLVPHYKESPLVQQAIADLEKMLPDRGQEKTAEKPQEKQAQKEPEKAQKTQISADKEKAASVPETAPEPQKQPEMIPGKDNSIPEGTGRKQSVLKALRERQAKLKQEQEKTEQKAQNHKKGEQEL